ncbi:Leucine-rich repeat (LRR) family protein [Melia azedarach]|uniref:Leucine-rich repeat (LRR) family protein n=1 Tax=Melia azedarach TaxID=155640 RepID=A0ACC1XIT1_MELAZ|nr:Leucine-rich repeat (LRR) family protein [Melia azedarach]
MGTLVIIIWWVLLENCFPALRNLYLNNNYLTGGIPDQLANLTNLEILLVYCFVNLCLETAANSCIL